MEIGLSDQLDNSRLTHRHREQARSHKGSPKGPEPRFEPAMTPITKKTEPNPSAPPQFQRDQPETEPAAMNHPTLTFAQLHPGDRFTLPADHRLFTKLTDSTAREHSVHSINLKEEGYGYAEAPIKNLPGEAPIEYVPVGGPLRAGG